MALNHDFITSTTRLRIASLFRSHRGPGSNLYLPSRTARAAIASIKPGATSRT